MIATIAAGVATDIAGNTNAAVDSHRQHRDLRQSFGPTVTINQAAAQADPTNARRSTSRWSSARPVIGFATGDVTLSGTAGGTLTAIVSGSGTTYNVAVSGMTAAAR